ncbi:MAG TPA: hypothetical protein VGB14_01755 [Acidimicrobiales bacterium]
MSAPKTDEQAAANASLNEAIIVGFHAAYAMWDGKDDDERPGVLDEVRVAIEAAIEAGHLIPADRLKALDALPLDGSYEILHSGCEDQGCPAHSPWVTFRPVHHLAPIAHESGVMVVARKREQ